MPPGLCDFRPAEQPTSTSLQEFKCVRVICRLETGTREDLKVEAHRMLVMHNRIGLFTWMHNSFALIVQMMKVDSLIDFCEPGHQSAAPAPRYRPSHPPLIPAAQATCSGRFLPLLPSEIGQGRSPGRLRPSTTSGQVLRLRSPAATVSGVWSASPLRFCSWAFASWGFC